MICPCCGKPKKPQNIEGLGTALKPAMELIAVARKPLSEASVAANFLTHGTGAINIDGCRVEGTPEPTRFDPAKHGHDGYRMTATGAETYARAMGRDGEASAERRYAENGGTNFAAKPGPRGGDSLGRWPANLIHDGSEEVLAAFPDAPGSMGVVRGNEASNPTSNVYGAFARQPSKVPRGDEGSAARFFYTAKADAHDRLGSKHPTVKPLDLMQWLVRLVTPKGGTVLDPFAGTGTTGEAAWREGMRAILIEREPEYVLDIEKRMSLVLGSQNERRQAILNAKGLNEPAESLPLFKGLADVTS